MKADVSTEKEGIEESLQQRAFSSLFVFLSVSYYYILLLYYHTSNIEV